MFRRLLLITRFIGGTILTIDGIALLFISGFTFGSILTTLVGLFLLSVAIYNPWMKKRLARKLYLAFDWALLTIVLFTMSLCCFITIVGVRSTATFNEDAVIVLGAGIKGRTVLKPLALRLNECVAYASKNPQAVIVVSGGRGDGEEISEAEAMESYLCERGVSNPIIREDRSQDTYENMLFSKAILDKRFENKEGGYKTAYITNDFHIYRAGRLGELVGIQLTAHPASLDFYLRPPSYLRETLSIIKFWVYR